MMRRAVPAIVLATVSLLVLAPLGVRAAADYPAKDAGYHSYAEMVDEIHAVAAAHPDLVRVFSIGTSYQGRRIWAAEVSDNVGEPEGEPEVLFDALHHAREHLTPEMALYILNLLVDRYGGTGDLARRVTRIVDSRRIWIVFMVNPDGLVYDLGGGPYGGGHYRGWRKNRQRIPGSRQIGVDLNRAYGYAWGCCGGSSGQPRDDNYRGPRPWFAPEVRAIRDFVLSRRDANGRNRISMHITFHTAGELVLWPYGYTRRNVPPDLTWLDYRAMRRIGLDMAASNGYTPQQSSDLYITDGDQIDWLYARERIFSYTFEMYPSRRSGTSINRFYPPDELIGRETRRNRAAVLTLMDLADCPYRALGAAEEQAYCGPLFDDLEINRGWRRNPGGADTASAGLWARGAPQGGAFQVGRAVSGQAVLATGLARGVDVDGGRTSIRSPMFRIPADAQATLRLRYSVGMGAGATAADRFRVLLVDADTGQNRYVALEIAGTGARQDPAWRSLTFPIPVDPQNRRLAIQLIAVDAPGADVTVEVAVDNPRITLE
jgi:murein tripeptide amidase MpaA